jgi:hypothetical protein
MFQFALISRFNLYTDFTAVKIEVELHVCNADRFVTLLKREERNCTVVNSIMHFSESVSLIDCYRLSQGIERNKMTP